MKSKLTLNIAKTHSIAKGLTIGYYFVFNY